jgi:hypothetical protein
MANTSAFIIGSFTGNSALVGVYTVNSSMPHSQPLVRAALSALVYFFLSLTFSWF